MAGRKVFSAGEVLQAADVNDFLMDQSVMVFAGTAARGSAIPSPTEGMVTYLADSDEVQVYDGSVFKAVGPGKILQVVSTVKTDTFSASVAASTKVSLTGCSATITPQFSSSKILVVANISMSWSTGGNSAGGSLILLRDATEIGLGDAAGSRTRVTSGQYIPTGNTTTIGPASLTYLDSPGTTSSITYSLQSFNISSVTQSVWVNRTGADSDSSSTVRSSSTVTLMEVAG